ncbi:MAG: hypothetical protein JXP73_03760 [Deltaproteobacteria bacterium]|nr:hypothetical protein [Deltaproteobacteria bacterium]
MAIPIRDSAPGHPVAPAAPDAKTDTVRAPEAPDAAWPREPDGASDLASTSSDGPGFAASADGCVPLTCREPTCFPAYCGEIGDGCGAALSCGDCAAGWSCKEGRCFPDDCEPISCDNTTPFPYCGTIGDGCGGALRCACPNPAWTCIGHVCNAESSGCVPIPGCLNSWGDEYCGGLIGDGCGSVLDCRRECSRAGFVCRGNLCVDTRDAGPPSGPVPPPTLPPPPPVPPPPPPPPCPPPPPAPNDE